MIEARKRLLKALDRTLAYLEAQIAPKPVKSVTTMADDFYTKLSEAVTGFFNKDQSAGQVESIMRQLIKSYAYDEYYEGMKDGGLDDPEGEITDAEDAQVSEWITNQLGFVDAFIQALKETRRAEDVTAAQAAINQRVELWRGSMENLGSLAKANALKDKLVIWRYGDTEHCTTCEKLNGQKHRLSWFLDREYIPQQNGSETLDCGGWHCQCTLEDLEGNQVMP